MSLFGDAFSAAGELFGLPADYTTTLGTLGNDVGQALNYTSQGVQIVNAIDGTQSAVAANRTAGAAGGISANAASRNILDVPRTAYDTLGKPGVGAGLKSVDPQAIQQQWAARMKYNPQSSMG